MKALLCRFGIHDWTGWSKPKRGKDTYWGFSGMTQDKKCLKCNKFQVREL